MLNPLIGRVCLKHLPRGWASLDVALGVSLAVIALFLAAGVTGCQTKPSSQAKTSSPKAASQSKPSTQSKPLTQSKSSTQAKPSSQAKSSTQAKATPTGHTKSSEQTKSQLPPQEAAKSEEIVLREGDTVRVTFPGSPELTKVQQIRRDGIVTLPLIGEFKAAGLTPTEMQKQLITLYEPQLQTKEILVSVDSAALSVYVTGAVLRPGKVASDHPLNALEAILEAGIDYNKADLKKVTVIRQEGDRTEHHVLNLKQVLEHREQLVPFSLRPSDIIYVPERFAWF